MGTSTPWARARSRTERQLLTPSAVCRVLCATCSTDMPRPSFSPNVLFRDSGELQVATRSPSPARPANVVSSAPRPGAPAAGGAGAGAPRAPAPLPQAGGLGQPAGDERGAGVVAEAEAL